VAEYMKLDFDYLSEDEQFGQSQWFFETMKKRRTVRDFSTRPVPFELIQNAIATAGRAPSGANQQPWTFVVVSDPDIKRKIRIAAEAEEKENYERRMSDEWLEALSHFGTDWQKPHIEDAPYLIIPFLQAYGYQIDTETGDQTRIKHYYAQESVGIAVGMLLAALHVAGLATLTHTPSPMNFLRDILNRPENERAYVLIPVGYPAEDAEVPVISKKLLDEILVHI
jgi:iodotyrosine deiodinase